MHEVDMLRDVASDAVRGVLKDLLAQALNGIRHAWPMKRQRLMKELPERLRDCVTDLRPCFAPSGSSFLYVIWNSGLDRTSEWHGVDERLRMAAAWFEGWDEMQKAIGESMTPEFFVRSLENLNRLLFWTSHTGEQLSKLVDQTPKNDLIRKPMHALVDKYNAFLTNYEGFLRRLPSDLGMRPLAPVQGMEAFFGRLRDPWSGTERKHWNHYGLGSDLRPRDQGGGALCPQRSPPGDGPSFGTHRNLGNRADRGRSPSSAGQEGGADSIPRASGEHARQPAGVQVSPVFRPRPER